MEASSEKLIDLMSTLKRVVVPVYQRPYSWDRKHCEQLWKDIVAVGRSANGTHFAGSVVWVSKGVSSSGMAPVLIIDGQQRVTTVSLLLIALAEYARDHEDDLGFYQHEIMESFLIHRHRKADDHYRLALSQDDNDVYRMLVDHLEDPTYQPALPPSSRLVQNLNLFRRWVAGLDDPACAWEGVQRLQVVSIVLDQHHDNPQVVFEKINSTGKELATSDLVRNFVLMTQPPEEQDRLYRNRWRIIEKTLGSDSYDKVFDDFLKDWLTVLRAPKSPVKKGDVYEVFKRFVAENDYDGGERMFDLLQEMERFARFYIAASTGVHDDKTLSRHLGRIARLRLSVANPLVMYLLDCHEAKALSQADLVSALDTLESYLVRRAVCDCPTNGLNKFFPSIVAKLRDARNNGESCLAVFRATLLDQETTTFRFPTDQEFFDRLVHRNTYDMKDRRAMYILMRLENSYHPKDERDFFGEGYTIEHIMPRNAMARQEWRDALGEGCEAKHAQLVHTIGNLTITAYNSELSDGTFAEKKARTIGGYDNEFIRISTDVHRAESWDEQAILLRGATLAQRALEVWATPAWPEGQARRRELVASGKKARHRVTLKELFDDDLLEEGTRLRIKGLHSSCASIGEEGTILLDNGESFRSPSPAAERVRELAGDPVIACNGWDYWILPDDRTIARTRDEYLAAHPEFELDESDGDEVAE